MGIWEDLRSVTAKLLRRKPPSVDYSVESFRLNPVLTNISKFAVDETIKGVSGGVQVFRTAKEGMKDQPSYLPSDGNTNRGLLLVMEEMLANMEATKDGSAGVKQHHKTSSQCNKGLEESLKEFSDEPVKSSVHEESGRRRIFIRSRL